MTIPTTVQEISRYTIKPKSILEEPQEPTYLTPWDLSIISIHYNQKGLLFTKPGPLSGDDYDGDSIITIIDQLKDSFSHTLDHFYPLAGRLDTHKNDNPSSISIFINSNNPPGAEFIHATANLSINDILNSIDVPPIVNSFFSLNGAINYDGHTLPLISVQVTELVDGIFIGCSLNHSVIDGNSFWHFFNVWSEISRGETVKNISRPPILKRWFLDGHGPINLPFSHPDDFIDRYAPPVNNLRVKFFHFSQKSIATLKAKANEEYNTKTISSFQALTALVWRSMTRARRLLPDQKTSCQFVIDNRSRLNPPLSKDYFGNCIQTVNGTCTAGELVGRGLGWAAWLLHEAVANHTDSVVRMRLEEYEKSPFIYQYRRNFNPCSLHFGSSPRFDLYSNDFGWGKAVAVRSGYANKFDGKVNTYPGRDGEGSVDMEVCLLLETMIALEADEEFKDSITS